MGPEKWETQKVHGRDEVLLDIANRAQVYSDRVVQDVKDIMNDYEVDMYRLILAVGKRYGLDTAFEIMSETVADKRLKWLDQAKDWLVLEGTDLEKGLKLFTSYFRLKDGEIIIIDQTEKKVVFKRKEFVNAITHTCGVLGLDIIEVNNKIYGRATNRMFERINPNLRHVYLHYQDGWYDEMIELSTIK
ncbi:MAG TPA: hypothetical protein VN376_09560 [Longilinea sp.]|nr:hypothetical protein [Longilinea sp.]